MRRWFVLALVLAIAAAGVGVWVVSALSARNRTVDFTYTPTAPFAGESVAFTATYHGGPKPTDYAWTYGDGTNGDGTTVTHTYTKPGVYDVNVTASGANSQAATASHAVTVLAVPPPPALQDSFTYAPASPTADQSVAFSASATGGTSPYTFTWQFGDGTSGSGSNASHAYSAAGTYNAVLTGQDASGASATASESVVVSQPAPPPPPPGLSADFSFQPSSPLVGATVFFNATATGGTSPYSFAWDFGDGSTCASQDCQHAFSAAGAYSVNLTASDSAGNVTSVVKSVVVSTTPPPPPPALSGDFSFTPTSPTVGQTVSFSATASGGTPPYSFAWTFGDSSTGSGANVTHAYSAAGSYTVSLKITDSASASVTASHGVTVASASNRAFDYVVTIIMENHAICDIMTTCGGSAPYMTSLAQQYGLATGYVDCNSPSLPNYLCLSGGTDFGCGGYDGNPNSNTCTATAWNSQNIVDRLEAGGLTWKAYMEDMPSDCYGSNSGNYAVRHDPFVYYSDIVTNPTRCALVVPAGSGDSALLNDLGSTSTAKNFMWLTPNVCNDMHSCSVSTGDSYLSTLVPQILGSTVFKTQRAALFITFDEDSGGSGAPDLYTVWAGPTVKLAYTSSASYGHFSYLATIEANWGLSPLTSNDANAAPMGEFFTSPLAAARTTPAPAVDAVASAPVISTPTFAAVSSAETWDLTSPVTR